MSDTPAMPPSYALSEFTTWMAGRGLSRATVTLYADGARALLKACGGDPYNVPAIRAYFARPDVSQGWLATTAKGWRMLAKFLLEAAPHLNPIPDPNCPVPFPPEVADAVLYLHRTVGIPVTALLLAHWRHVAPDGLKIQHPSVETTRFVLGVDGRARLAVIRAWAAPLGVSDPLLPLYPQGDTPRTAKDIRDAIADATARAKAARLKGTLPHMPVVGWVTLTWAADGLLQGQSPSYQSGGGPSLSLGASSKDTWGEDPVEAPWSDEDIAAAVKRDGPVMAALAANIPLEEAEAAFARFNSSSSATSSTEGGGAAAEAGSATD